MLIKVRSDPGFLSDALQLKKLNMFITSLISNSHQKLLKKIINKKLKAE
jgi:hypothetical protein